MIKALLKVLSFLLLFFFFLILWWGIQIYLFLKILARVWRVYVVIIVAILSTIITFLAGLFLGLFLFTRVFDGWHKYYYDWKDWRNILIVIAIPILLACSAFVLIFVFQENIHRIIAGLVGIFFTGFSYSAIVAAKDELE